MGKEINRILGKLGQERGVGSEVSVDRAVKNCIGAGIVPAWLTGYEPASPEEDAQGIDGWFFTDAGKIPIQIKASRRPRRDLGARRNRIPVIVVPLGLNDKEILAKCLSAVGRIRKRYIQERDKE